MPSIRVRAAQLAGGAGHPQAEDERDFSEVERLRLLLRDPFTEQPGMESYADPPPDWGRHLVVSYSS